MATPFSIVEAWRSTRLGLSLCERALHRFPSWIYCQRSGSSDAHQKIFLVSDSEREDRLHELGTDAYVDKKLASDPVSYADYLVDRREAGMVSWDIEAKCTSAPCLCTKVRRSCRCGICLMEGCQHALSVSLRQYLF